MQQTDPGKTADDDHGKRLVDAAELLIVRDGMHAVTVDAIAAAARVSKKAIYERFANKEEIFAAVLDRVTSRMPSAGIEPDAPLRDALERFAQTHLRYLNNPPVYHLMRIAIEAMREFPEVSAGYHERRRSTARDQIGYIAAGIDAGRIRSNCGDALNLATRIGSVAMGGARPLFLGDDRMKSIARRSAFAADLLAYGYRGIEGQSPPFREQQIDSAGEAMPQTSRLRPEKKEKLLTTAARIFCRDGMRQANIDEIIAASGVARSTIYRNFENKEGLFYSAIQHRIATMDDPVGMDASGPMDSAVEATTIALLKNHARPESLSLQRILIEEQRTVPDLAKAFYQQRLNYTGRALSAIFAQADLPAPSLDLVEGYYILATFSVRFIASEDRPSSAMLEEAARHGAHIFLGGIAGPQA